ncbi:hypothetical protein C8Q74DRAFT_743742 [Fomes fomentarius]|nr:hypothetical protein C8Q74DRAFT_743742 [Fomes fomentarius]
MSATHRSATSQVEEGSAVRPPPSPMHNRMFSDSTVIEEAKSPNSFNDTLVGSPLPYRPTNVTPTLNGRASNISMKDPERGVPHSPTGWKKMMELYDHWYQRLKSHWILFVAFVLASIVCCSIAIGWSFRLKTFNIADTDSEHNAIVQLSANLVDVDPLVQKMIVDWNIKYDCERIGCPDVDLYFDANTLRSDPTSVQSNVKPSPIFSVIGSNVLAMNNNSDRRSSSLTFRTEVAITNANTHRTLQSYPYDKYTTQLVFFAEQLPSNDTVSIAIVKTTGIAVGFNVELQNTTDISDNFGTVIKNIEVTRGPVVRLYAMFIVIVIWLVTLTFMATCVLNVFFGKGISTGVLVLPMGTLFAFTQLRATLPGAPVGFGAVIDFVGLLPCLAILTFCSVFMTAIFILRNPEEDIERWKSQSPSQIRRRSTVA